MYKGKKIGIIVPAYNERESVAMVINTIPHFVDRIYVVNDGSTDDTVEMACDTAGQKNKVALINREKRGGVGMAIISGHKMACKDKMDIMAVMAGDGQMDPEVLDQILNPIVEGKADYSKGNRLSTPQNRKEMPAWRTFGNFLLTYLTRIASGYWHISDPQNGYSAIARGVLQKLDLDGIETGFAFENDMLIKLNVVGARVVDVPHPAKYGKGRSKIRYPRFIARTSWLLLKGFLWRIREEHMKRPSGKVSR